MFNQIMATTIKDLKIMFKDPGALALLFMMPIIFILVMSLALANMFTSDGGPPTTVLLVVEDAGAPAARVADQMQDGAGFTALNTWEGAPLTRAQAEALIIGRVHSLALIIPDGFSQAATSALFEAQSASATAHLELLADPATPAYILGPIQGAVTGLSQQALGEELAPLGLNFIFDQLEQQGGVVPSASRANLTNLVAEGNNTRPLVELHTAAPAGMRVERLPNSVEQNVPGYTLFGVFFIAQHLAESLISERRLGTYRRLLAAPLPRSALMLGKLQAFLLINLIQIVVMFVIGIYILPLFGAPRLGLGAHPLALVPVSLAVALAANGLGLLVAALSSTPEQVSGLGLLFVIPMAVLGGVMAPRAIMPESIQLIGLAAPHTWALQAYQDIIIRGANVIDILPAVGMLLLFALVFFGLARWRLRW